MHLTAHKALLFEPMTSAPQQKRSRKKDGIAGLNAAARALGVSRGHLSRVLHGHRSSPRLVRLYAAWLDKQAAR